jgi:hypothetical protein
MYYTESITLPANGSINSLVTKELNLCYGWIKQVEITFPDGCCGFAAVNVLHFNTQVFPSNEGAWIKSNNETVKTTELIDLTTRPYTLLLRGYNTDDTYDHTIYFRFYVDSTASDLVQSQPSSTTVLTDELNKI